MTEETLPTFKYPSYAEVQDVLDAMQDVGVSATTQTYLQFCINRVSRLIDEYTNRKPGAYKVSEDSVQYFDGSGLREQSVDEMCAVPTKVEVAEGGVVDGSALTSGSAGGSGGVYTLWPSSYWFCYPYNALDRGQPFTQLHLNLIAGFRGVWMAYPRAVKITTKFGFSQDVPDLITHANVIQTVRTWKRGQGAFKDAGANAELGKIIYTQALDKEVCAILDTMRRPAV
jgi:hypothetical protein